MSRADLAQVAVLGAITFAILVIKRRDFTLYAFDPPPHTPVPSA